MQVILSMYHSGFSALHLGKGFRALSQFAFKNTDICWEELEWKGKHGQSLAMVATKPHYFLDLDIQRTVENFLDNVPEFWSFEEFAESVKDDDIFFIDRSFFVHYFIALMHKQEFRDVWDVVNEFLMQQPFSSLCRRLLITLEDQDFATLWNCFISLSALNWNFNIPMTGGSFYAFYVMKRLGRR
ncbi:hypothetical protein HKD37_16G044973 [Glycine soja]